MTKNRATNPHFRRRRAAKGGRARAARYSILWQQLLQYYRAERRAKRAAETSFHAWLYSRGLGRVAETATQ